MKKFFLISSIGILFVSVTLLIFVNVTININKNRNDKVLEKFNNIFLEEEIDINDNSEIELVKMQIDNIDYVGVINIEVDDLIIPVESDCSDSLFKIQSACNYSSSPFVILGTNLKDSFTSYKTYNLNDTVMFTNSLGQTFQYKIKSIKRINKLNELSQLDEELIIVIKNYYDMEYIMYICDSY